VRGRSIPFVLGKSIPWVQFIHRRHVTIPDNLCHNTGSRYGQTLRVASHNRARRRRKSRSRRAIHKNIIRRGRQIGHSSDHRRLRRPQNIQLVNFTIIRHPDAYCNVWKRLQAVEKKLAFLRGKLFGICQPAEQTVLFSFQDGAVNYHRRCHHWSRKRTSPRFIHASKSPITDPPVPALKAEQGFFCR